MTLKLAVESTSDGIAIIIQINNVDSASIPLDRYTGSAFLTAIARALMSIPSDPTAPIHKQEPAIYSRHPYFEVGTRDNQNVVLAIRPDPLGPLVFDLSLEATKELAEGLLKAVAELRGA